MDYKYYCQVCGDFKKEAVNLPLVNPSDGNIVQSERLCCPKHLTPLEKVEIDSKNRVKTRSTTIKAMFSLD